MKAIETEIDIRADAPVVWDVLTDLPRYCEWNPFVTEACGEVRRGARLKVRICPPGGKAMCFKPRLVTVQPGRELSWVGRVLLPGVFDGWHSFRISATGSGVRLYHCERFTGLFSAFFGRDDLRAVRDGFVAMNEALRDRCEALAEDLRKVA